MSHRQEQNTLLSPDGVAEFLAHLEGNRKQLLRDHLFAVSEAARRHSDKIGIGAAGAAVGLLHDFGKYSRSFQEYLRRMSLDQDTEQPDPERGKIDHSTAGAQTIWRTLKQQDTLQGVVGELLAICVASHHSGLIDCITPGGFDNLSRRMNKPDPESHFDEVRGAADESVTLAYTQYLQDPKLVSSIRDLVARIGQRDRNTGIRQFKIGLLVRFLFSCLIDADRTDTADFSNGTVASLRQHGRYAEWSVLVRLLEEGLKGFSSGSPIDELRRQVSELCLEASARPTGTYLLTVPTGGGKTLASLRFALHHAEKWEMDRVIYVSPYTSIIDQNAKVVRDILEPAGTEFASVVLEHHSNLTPLHQTWKSKILSENWDAPVVFTTAVQLLEGLFGSGTRAVRRMHQMARSVLIFDETQTVPIRCVHLLNNALNFLVEQCGSTVVLCTATQPLLHEVDPAKGAIRLGEHAEIMQNVPALFAQIRRYETYDRRKSGGSWEHSEAADLAISETRRAGSCLVVVNTKREALSIFNECRTRGTSIAVTHLSTSMCPAHRLKSLDELKELLNQGAPAICVSTQLIEAGVDISFGSAIRALAGIDSIAQAAGRCNRHGEADLGRVHIINLARLPKALREIRLAQEAAERVLDESAGGGENGTVDLSDPRLIALYFRYYFFDRQNDMDYPVGPDKAERNDTLLNMLAENRLAVSGRPAPPPVSLRQAFQKAADAFEAIDASTRGVIVPYTSEGKALIGELCAAFDLSKQFKLLKRAQQFTVNVFPHVLNELQRTHAVHEVQEGTGILHLDERWYSDDFGLNIEGTEAMEFEYA